MIRYYLRIGIRNITKNKFYSIINIAGLSIGLAVAILILSYVWFELSFDRFHSKFEQTYRVVQSFRLSDKENNWGKTSYSLASVLKEEIPEIIHTSRLNYYHSNNDIEVSINEKKFIEKQFGQKNVVRADNDIFKIFDIVLIQGDSETVLNDPYSMVITDEESRKYFGDENPIGKIVNIRLLQSEKGTDYKITGVAKKMPDNSHFEFKYMIPQDEEPWTWYKFAAGWTYTYITLPADYPSEELEKKFPEIVNKYFTPDIEDWALLPYKDWLESDGYWKLGLQPLKDIHLDHYYWDSHLIKKENPFNIKMYSVIALFIIFLACVNFINLSTASSGARAKEVGVRKVFGATRKQLIWQFLIESILLSIIVFIVALILIKFFSAYFNELLEIKTFNSSVEILVILIASFAVTLIIGVLSGSYPAFFLSSYKPVNVLKGQLLEKMKGKRIRNSLVTFQFTISILLIISSISVYKQFVYMKNKNLGFERENIVVIKNMFNGLWRQYQRNMSRDERVLRITTLKQELLKNPNISNVSYIQTIQGLTSYGRIIVRAEGTLPEQNELNLTFIDHDFLNVFGLEMVAGKNFRKGITIPQTVEGAILNESAVRHLGLKNPVGKHIYCDKWFDMITNEKGEDELVEKKASFPIIGVFKDFHTHNLYEPIKPVIYFPLFKGEMYSKYLAVRFSTGNMHDNITFLEKTWNEIGAVLPLEYSFFNKDLERIYTKEKKLSHVFTFFTILAVIIACLGIYGLAVYAATKRTKEIGIRKVNGASINEIMYMLNKDFVKWVFIAFVIACPVAYYVMNKWLENFAFKTTLSWWVFALAGGITLLIALLTVSWESYKAATRNPVEALRDE